MDSISTRTAEYFVEGDATVGNEIVGRNGGLVKDRQTNTLSILNGSAELFIPDGAIAFLFVGRSMQKYFIAIDRHVRIECTGQHVAQSSRIFGRPKVGRLDNVNSNGSSESAHVDRLEVRDLINEMSDKNEMDFD